MKKPWVIVLPLLVVLFAVAAFPQQKGGGAIESFSVNGLTVILKTIDANEIIAANLYLRGGATNLSEATQGIESFIFDCAVKGSRDYPKEKLNALLDRTAAGINSNATKDMSSIGLRCVKGDFDILWGAFADVVMHPSFVPEDVNVVRDNALLAIRQRKDDPDTYLNEMADGVFYAGHPYRLDPNGTDSAMTSLTIDQMRKYLTENLVTSKLLLVVVGNVSRADIEKKVAGTLGTLPKGTYVSRLPDPVRHSAPTLKVIERPLPTNYVRGMFTLPSPGDPDFYAAMVMMSILRDRVFEEVRTKRNLSYAPAAGMLNRFANAGIIYVTAVNPDSAVKVMLGELTKMQKEPVSAKDLKDRITLFLTMYNLQRETNESQAQFLAFHEVAGLGWEAAAHFVERTRQVTAVDIQKVAAKYFHNLQFVIIGNPTLVNRTVYAY
jgi:zinc protease